MKPERIKQQLDIVAKAAEKLSPRELALIEEIKRCDELLEKSNSDYNIHYSKMLALRQLAKEMEAHGSVSAFHTAAWRC